MKRVGQLLILGPVWNRFPRTWKKGVQGKHPAYDLLLVTIPQGECRRERRLFLYANVEQRTSTVTMKKNESVNSEKSLLLRLVLGPKVMMEAV